MSFTALLVLVWVVAAWWAVEQLPHMAGIERTFFLDRSIFCLLVYGVFIAYYVWRSFKPEHWALRDHDGYEYPSTLDLTDYWSRNMRRYKQMVMDRRRGENEQ
ncbi:hypothetical protein E2P71_05225 [Candidatus Bathyarchaeota archaeon]|nr:hypothetical protein E2P71_05225 [Candidatus Bathyarchaeota archaeon]